MTQEPTSNKNKTSKPTKKRKQLVHPTYCSTTSPLPPPKIVILISSLSVNSKQDKQQNKMFNTLDMLRVKFELCDGSLNENRDRRDLFFDISSIKGKYPQIFKISSDLLISYIGNADEFQELLDNNKWESMIGDCILKKITVEELKKKAEEKLKTLSQEEIESIKEVFEILDEDQNGELEKSELKYLYSQTDPTLTEEGFLALFDVIDHDDSGSISFEEFLLLMAGSGFNTQETTSSEVDDDDIKQAFDLADEDNSGTIDILELKQLMLSLGQRLSNKKLKKLLKKIDKDNDGEIAWDEFKLFVEKCLG